MNRLFIVCLLVCASVNSVWSQNKDSLSIGIDEHLGQIIPGDIRVINEQGQWVSLDTLIKRPTVIALVYFRCPGICSPLMEGMANLMDISPMVPGADYDMLTISFDPRENIDLGIRKKRNYVQQMSKKEIASTHWQFFASDTANIHRLTEAIGFRYKQVGNDYLHTATLTIVSPDRKITRYLNGTYFLPFELKMATIEASKGLPGPTINKVLQYCYSYSPESQNYVMDITKVAGIIIAFMLVMFVLYLIIRKK